MIKEVRKFLVHDLWQHSSCSFDSKKRLLVKNTKVLIIAVMRFKLNNCYLRASALTYYTILSIVPLFALAFAVCKGFGMDDKLQDDIYSKFQGNEETINRILSWADNLMDKTKGELIAGIGVVILLWTIIKLFSNIEHSFNEIWSVKKSRPLLRKVTDYLSMAFICPILLVISGSSSVYISSNVLSLIYPSSLIKITFTYLTSFLTIWILFAFLYKFIPNRKINNKAVIAPAIIAGTGFYVLQVGYYDTQIFVTKYNAIYGSFAALPLLMLWIQLSWLIVLFGAELSYAIQSIKYYEFECRFRDLSDRLKKVLILKVMILIAKNFKNENSEMTNIIIADKLQIPINLINDILKLLIKASLISKVVIDDNSKSKRHIYHPSKPVDKYSVGFVLKSIELTSNKKEPEAISKNETEEIKKLLNQFDNLISKSEINLHLLDI